MCKIVLGDRQLKLLEKAEALKISEGSMITILTIICKLNKLRFKLLPQPAYYLNLAPATIDSSHMSKRFSRETDSQMLILSQKIKNCYRFVGVIV